MSDEFKSSVRSKSVWLRGFFMLLFAVFYGVSEIVLTVVAVFQFGCCLFTGRPNGNATRFGNAVGQYIFQIAQFVTFNSDQRPFPFSPWPRPQTPGASGTPEPAQEEQHADRQDPAA